MKKLICMFLMFVPLLGFAQQLQTNISVHDPVMIKSKGTYYLFCTGSGITVWSSVDLKNWKNEQPVFSITPSWAVKAIPELNHHIWAPDISYWKGTYYLYYSVSAFGKNTSAIGLATNQSLDPKDSKFRWIDHGKIIQSYPGITNWNAIDPNLITDEKGRPYLSLGSFWDGLKIVGLTKNRLKIKGDSINLLTIASRNKDSSASQPSMGNIPTDAGGNAIEGAFIYKKNGYYYLFASIDYCCKGPESTYKIIVGRSAKVMGPYLDKQGNDMRYAGGTLVLEGNQDWYGVGHNAVLKINGADYLVYHGYDAHDEAKSKLQIKKIKWDTSGWPMPI